MESFFFTGADGANVEGFIMKPPNFRSGKEISGEVCDAWRAADGVGGFVELSLELGVAGGGWLCGGGDQSARVYGVWAKVCG